MTDAPVLDLKSRVTADALGAKFEDIALSLDNAAEPQTMTGSATALGWAFAFRSGALLEMARHRLARRRRTGQRSPHKVEAARDRPYAIGCRRRGDAKINLEQVKVGGETAGGLTIDAERTGSTTHFNTFKASFPGGTRLDLTGDLKDSAGKLSFSGKVFIARHELGASQDLGRKVGHADRHRGRRHVLGGW